MSEKFGKKPTLVLSVAIASFPLLLYTVAIDWHQLIPWSMIYAASFAVFIPARNVYIADCTDVDKRAKMYGRMNLAWPIGSLVGPTVAGLLAEVGGFNLSFYFVTAVTLLSFIPTLLLVERRSKSPTSIAGDPVTKGVGFSRGSIYILILLTCFHLTASTGIGTTYSLISIYLKDTFAVDKFYIGLFFSLIGVSIFGSQIVGGWASSRFGLKKTMMVCLSVIPPLFIACAFAPSYELLAVIYLTLFGLYSMTWPTSITILMNHIDRSKWGLTTGIRSTGIRLGFTIGPILGGALWEVYSANTPFYASAAFIILSILFIIPLREEL